MRDTKRDKVLKKLWKMASEITGENSHKWTRDKENKIWELACDNDIFVCQLDCGGIGIEDDCFYMTEEH